MASCMGCKRRKQTGNKSFCDHYQLPIENPHNFICTRYDDGVINRLIGRGRVRKPATNGPPIAFKEVKGGEE